MFYERDLTPISLEAGVLVYWFPNEAFSASACQLAFVRENSPMVSYTAEK